MSRQHANILRAFAGWTLFIWAVLVRNIWAGDRALGFKLVHTVLAVISVVLATVTLWVVAQNRGRNAPRLDG